MSTKFESALLRVPLDPAAAREALPLIRSLCDEMEAALEAHQLPPAYMGSVLQHRTWDTMQRINSLTNGKKRRHTK